MAETIDSVFRDFNTPGNPGSGDYEPEKPRIRALLRQLQGQSGAAVTRNTLASLNSVTPPSENYMGIVLDDPDAENNGYYYRQANAWVFGRGFPDTFARVELSGTGTAQTGAVATGVVPANVEVFFAFVGVDNTGPLTLSIHGEPPREVVNLAGNAMAAGEWTGAVMFARDGAQYRLLLDAGAAASAAQSASDAADQKSYAQEWAQSPNPISVEAGGDGASDRSAKTWAEQAQQAAGSVIDRAFVLDVPSLLADDNQEIGYVGSGARFELVPGNVIRTQKEGFGYEVAASDATDNQLETAGGVKLNVLMGNDGRWNVLAFGAKGDGVSDDHQAFQKAVETGGCVCVPRTGLKYILTQGIDFGGRPLNIVGDGVVRYFPQADQMPEICLDNPNDGEALFYNFANEGWRLEFVGLSSTASVSQDSGTRKVTADRIQSALRTNTADGQKFQSLRGLTIRYFHTGIEYQAHPYNVGDFSLIKFGFCKFGIRFTAFGGSTHMNKFENIHFANCQVGFMAAGYDEATDTYDLNAQGDTRHLLFDNCVFEFTEYGILSGSGFSGLTPITLTNVWFEQCEQAAYRVQDVDVTEINCRFDNSPRGIVEYSSRTPADRYNKSYIKPGLLDATDGLNFGSRGTGLPNRDMTLNTVRFTLASGAKGVAPFPLGTDAAMVVVRAQSIGSTSNGVGVYLVQPFVPTATQVSYQARTSYPAPTVAMNNDILEITNNHTLESTVVVSVFRMP